MRSEKPDSSKEKPNRLGIAKEPLPIKSSHRLLPLPTKSEKCVFTESDSSRTLNSGPLNWKPVTNKPPSKLRLTSKQNLKPLCKIRSEISVPAWPPRPRNCRMNRQSSTLKLLSRSMKMSPAHLKKKTKEQTESINKKSKQSIKISSRHSRMNTKEP